MHANFMRTIAVLLGVSPVLGVAQTSTPNQPPDSTSDSTTSLSTVTVTGSLIPRTDVETTSPVQIITAEQIKNSGFTTIADVVTSISANNSGSIPTAFTAGFAGGSSGVALRGLTVNSTLVLVDGLRMADYALDDDGQRAFVDLNTIPLSAVERIDVLKDGASSIYGADAIAGVVNIILKHDFKGGDFSAEIGNSKDGGFQKRATGTFGMGDLNKDGWNGYVAFEYEGDDRIRVSSRDFPYNTADLSSLGYFNGIGGQPAEGKNPGSIYGSVTPATQVPGGTIANGATAIPNALSQPLRPCGPGSTLVNDPSGTLLTNGAGSMGSFCTQNFDSQYRDIQPDQERVGMSARFTLKLNDLNEAYVNFNYYQNKVLSSAYPSEIQSGFPNNTNGIALPPTLTDGSLNPNNPFAAQGQWALINYAFGDIPAYAEQFNHVLRGVVGLKGSLGDWNYNADVNINHTRLDVTNAGFLNYNQLISDIATGAYSFINPTSNSPAVIAALSPPDKYTATSDLDSIDLNANRTFSGIWGGDLGVGFGGTFYHEAQSNPSLNPNNEFQGLGQSYAFGSRNIAAVFGEVQQMWKTLEVDVSARYDHYSDFGSAFTPKFALKWTPIDQIALRGTYARGFRAPSFAESGTAVNTGFTTESISAQSYPNFIAAHGGGDGYTLPYAIGLETAANPHIQPEHSQSLDLGAVFQPIEQISATVDYYAIKKTNNIVAGPLSGTALNNYLTGQPLPSGYSIVPDIPDPQYPNALPRPLIVVAQYENGQALKTEGLDINLHGKFALSDDIHFVTDLNVTDVISWKQINQDGSTLQYVGTQGPYILSSGAGTPRWRADWANTLSWGRLDSSLSAYYTSGLYMAAPDLTGDYSCFSAGPSGNNFPSNCRTSSFIDVDLQEIFHYSDHVDVFGGVRNLLDRKPPFDPIDYAALNYNPTWAQAGIVGRFYTLGVRVKF